MRTTVDLSDQVLKDAMELTGSKTKKEAVSRALEEFIRREKMARLADELAGCCPDFMLQEELMEMRAKGQHSL